jgi:hypothetical protein
MAQKRRALQIQQGVVTDLISHLAGLPEREKSSDDLLSLPEIFRTKEYMAEIRGALKKGYTFDDLAEIFSERCGVTITARQIKYHHTRGEKQDSKSKTGKKGEAVGHQKKRASSKDTPRKDTDESKEMSIESVERSSQGPATVSDNRSVANVKPGAFLISMTPEEI